MQYRILAIAAVAAALGAPASTFAQSSVTVGVAPGAPGVAVTDPGGSWSGSGPHSANM